MPEPLISVNGLSHAFGDGATKKTVLEGVGVNFYPGEIVIVMGPSGAGKTTLLSLVGALRSVQTGSVSVAGTELRNASPRQLRAVRRRVGFIFQEHNLVASLTACENVQLALASDPTVTNQSSRKKAVELLTLVGLREFAGKLPRELSGGQKQRIAIARALVRSPEIILADEPTAALDGHSGRAVVELLQHLARQIGCAVLLVTHDNRILDVADRILTLEDGRMDETNLRLDRLTRQVSSLVALLATYPMAFGNQPEITAISEQFDLQVQDLREALATVANQRGSATSGRAMRWMTILENLRSLRDCLHQIAGLVQQPPEEATSYTELLRDSLEFLMQTTAQTFETPAAASLELLIQLTDDNGASVISIRNDYVDSQRDLAPEAGRFIFDLAGIFLRTSYFLNKIAKELETATAP